MLLMRRLLPLVVGLVPAVHGQDLRLSARLNGSAFFEGEPIYLVVELHNMGSDTVWTPPLDFAYGVLRGSVTRRGEPVPEFVVIADRFVGDEKRWPLAPGQSSYTTLGLLSRWGYPGDLYRSLFLQHLPPDEYVFTASLAPVQGMTAFSQALRTEPVRFSVHSRSGDEELVYESVRRLGQLKLDRRSRSGFLTAVIAWSKERLAIDSTDPFVPHLLSAGVKIADGLGPRSEAQTAELLGLQIAAARRHRSSPAGALLLDVGPLRDAERVMSDVLSEGDSSLLAAVLESRLRPARK